MFNIFKRAKWETVNIINEDGLSAKISWFGNVHKVQIQIIVKERKKQNGSTEFKCIASTGFTDEEISCDYVMGMFGLHTYEELKNYKRK